jgi:hypothetical protein
MFLRRRCRRHCFHRLIIFIFTLFSTISTVTWTYQYISQFFHDRYNPFDQIYFIDETDLNDARIESSRDIHLVSKEFFNTTQLTCQYPKLNLDNQDVWKHLQPVTKAHPDCEKSTNWVYVENGEYTSHEKPIMITAIAVVHYD